MPLLMGTAGHIDHGKTSLVKALTGIDCDRLAEEKKRGITIELGFAHIKLGNIELGIIDVPGHEKFVKNMVAGAAGIDFVMLVIAADEGIMPQTREHIAICSLLGIKTGLVVLTKIDMVESEWLELVKAEIKTELRETFLNESPIIEVSAYTGFGLDNLKIELQNICKQLVPRKVGGIFRMPIDRAFSIHGHGTVVTGTTVAGKINISYDLEIYPSEKLTKVRSLQVHGGLAECAEAGSRTAINLYSVTLDEVKRGNVLARPNSLENSKFWDILITHLPLSPHSLKNRTTIHLHHGTEEILAKLVFWNKTELKPGETALCQLQLPEALPSIFGDFCVIRSFSPLQTIAGGTIINPLGKKVKYSSENIELLSNLIDVPKVILIEQHILFVGKNGISFKYLSIVSNSAQKELSVILQTLSAQQKIICFDKTAKIYIHSAIISELSINLFEYMTDLHKKFPDKNGVSQKELESSWGKQFEPQLTTFLIINALKHDKLIKTKEYLHLAEHNPKLTESQKNMEEKILEYYEKTQLTPLNKQEVLALFNFDEKNVNGIYKRLCDEKKLIKISEAIYIAVGAWEKLINKVYDFFKSHENLTLSDLKELTEGISRKYLVAYIEYMDKEKLTIRVNDTRILRK